MNDKRRSGRKPDWPLAAAALMAAILNVYGIWNDHYVNAYYTAAVTSMLQSFHNFFYASLDPGGFVTVDKPPLTFWIQTISAKIFGLHGWSVILPQALAGVGSVLLVYALVKPSFGRLAARLAAFAAACTPVAAAVSRTNNVDAMLVFTLLVATWLLFKAVRTGKWGWAVGAFAVVGLGFNEKMMQAFMVLPAFYLFYLIAFKTNWKRKVAVLAGATAALVIVSLSWAVYVDSVPKDQRPYIGSSQTNSVLELALGYNGVSRLTGNRGIGGGGGGGGFGGGMPNGFRMQNPDGTASVSSPTGDDGGSNNRGNGSSAVDGSVQMAAPGSSGNAGGQGSASDDGMSAPNGTDSQSGMSGRDGRDGGFANGRLGRQGFQGGGFPGGGMFNTGRKGPLRLFQSELSGQASWLLPFVGFAAVGLLSGIRRKQPLTAKQKETLFWLAWLLPVMGFFSVAGFFHQYYLIMLAPPIAALVGAGWTELWSFYRDRAGWRRWLLPAGVAATTAFEVYVLYPYADQIGILWPIVVGVVGLSLSVILTANIWTNRRSYYTAIAALAVLLLAPLYWAATPIVYGQSSQLPAAGPSSQSGFGGGRGGSVSSINEGLYEYLKAHNTGEKFLFATTNVNTAETYIIHTGEAVMAMGGFSGSDPILTVDKLKELVQEGQVKYFYLSGGGRGGNSEVTQWIQENGTEIPSSEYDSGTSASSASVKRGSGGFGGFGGGPESSGGTLYEVTLN
ncbi:glycosyltransferase family 39 protein [Cohnella thermotolerans]|uniref:glycosyltransferase family 39 protein n=1 Tax=Cohnella thermotolerans TaxID=329858 RepID=UPI0004168079|nr:glycosyltransferase family 39 protein [Cohnella thermotolerans]